MFALIGALYVTSTYLLLIITVVAYPSLLTFSLPMKKLSCFVVPGRAGVGNNLELNHIEEGRQRLCI